MDCEVDFKEKVSEINVQNNNGYNNKNNHNNGNKLSMESLPE